MKIQRGHEEESARTEQQLRSGGESESGERSLQPAANVGGDAGHARRAETGELELEPPISLLPRDLLLHILSFLELDLSDRCRVRRVCRAWHAAALEPPHSTTLTLSLPCRRVLRWAGNARATKGRGAGAEAPEAQFLSRLRAALASPLGTGLTRASFTLERQPSNQPPPKRHKHLWRRVWPLAQALRALPASITRLSLHGPHVEGADTEGLQEEMRVLGDALPNLSELKVCDRFLYPFLYERRVAVHGPAHSALQRLDVQTGVRPRFLAGHLPSLTHLERLCIDDNTTAFELRQLADQGLKVRSLVVRKADMTSPGFVDAVDAIFRPAQFDWSLPGRSELLFSPSALPDAGLAGGFGAGVQRIELGFVRPAMFPWLTRIAMSPILREISFLRGADFTDVAPVELFRALSYCHKNLEIIIRWPINLSAAQWYTDISAAFLFLFSERQLLVALRLRLGELVAAVRTFECSRGTAEEWGGAAGPLTTRFTVLAAGYHVGRCQVLLELRSLLPHELWELSRVRDGLEGLLPQPADSAWQDVIPMLLGRCRALGDGRWPQWPPEAPLPAITRLRSLRLDAASSWDRAALPVLAAKGFRTRKLHLTGLDLTEPDILSSVCAIFDPEEVPGRRRGPAQIELCACRPPPAGSGFGAGAQRISLDTPFRSALPWIAEVSRSPRLRALALAQNSPTARDGHAFLGAEAFPSPAELLAALRGCREELQISIPWPAPCGSDGAAGDGVPGWDLDGLAGAVALLAADPALLAAVRWDLAPLLRGAGLDPRLRTRDLAALELGPGPPRALALHAELTLARLELAAGRRALGGGERRRLARLRRALEAVREEGPLLERPLRGTAESGVPF